MPVPPSGEVQGLAVVVARPTICCHNERLSCRLEKSVIQ
jgi:hypothetical protein